MQIFWSEITITDAEDGSEVTGNVARDKLHNVLHVTVGDDDGDAAAWFRLESGQRVSCELVPIMIKKLAEKEGKTYRVVFKEGRGLVRPPEVYNRFNVLAAAQRESLNTFWRPVVPYVIIGNGVAATVDHTTLRQTGWGRSRVGWGDVVHIGFQDPWAHYNKHEMGQFPHLLGLPGYEQRPLLGGPDDVGREDVSQPRDSTKLAGDTRNERRRLDDQVTRNTGEDRRYIPWCVLVIVPRGVTTLPDSVRGALLREGVKERFLDLLLSEEHPYDAPRYRLLLSSSRGYLAWYYADKIDICTGAGKARAVDETMVSSAIYEATRTRIWEPVETWDEDRCNRTILTGTEGLYRETNWGIGKRYCVMGSGGVGVNMIERAGQTEKWVDWLATKTLHDSFPIGRNDILLKQPDNEGPAERYGQVMRMNDFDYGRKVPTTTILPANVKWRFGQACDVASVTRVEARLKVVFKSTEGGSAIRDSHGQRSAFDAGALAFSDQYEPPEVDRNPSHYDRLIRCAGQDIRDVGQAEKVAALLSLVPIVAGADKRMVGLQTADGSIRVLGAAGTGNAALVDANDAAVKNMRAYHDTLPAQGRIMFVGFVFSSLNVAMANHYFNAGFVGASKRNFNVNTMSVEELEEVLEDQALAAKIIKDRKSTEDGYTTLARLLERLRAQAVREVAAITPLADGWDGLFDNVGNLPLLSLQNDAALVLGQAATEPRLGEKIAQARTRLTTYADKGALKAGVLLTPGADQLPGGWQAAVDNARVPLADLLTKLLGPLTTALANNAVLAGLVIAARTAKADVTALTRIAIRDEVARQQDVDALAMQRVLADQAKLAPTQAWAEACKKLSTSYRLPENFFHF